MSAVLAVVHPTLAAVWLGSMSYSLTALGVIVTAPRAVAIGYGVALLLYLGATWDISHLTARLYGLDSSA